MTNGKDVTLADIAKRIDEQARFTRSVSIICTLAVLGVLFYGLTEIFNGLPQAVILQYMANMEPLVKEWRAAEANSKRTETVKTPE
jgi:hypothetical protein